MVSAWDSQSGGPRFKSRSGHLLDLFSVVPSSNPRSRLYIANCMPGILVPGWDFYPRRDFAQKAKSRGGTLVTRAYILTVEIYSQYARKNLDLLEQGPRGIGR